MTALALSTLSRGSLWLKAVGKYFADLGEGLREGQEMARRYEELSRLSDEALAARGITRDELPQAILTGRICR